MTKPVFDNAAARLKTFPLQWPFTLDGVRYEAIGIRRLTTAQVSEFVESLGEAEKDGSKIVRFPLFVMPNGDELPDGVLDALDDDDSLMINEAAADFLPRRFQVKAAATAP